MKLLKHKKAKTADDLVAHFQIDGRSTNIIFSSGKESLERLFEISSIIKEYYNKGNK